MSCRLCCLNLLHLEKLSRLAWQNNCNWFTGLRSYSIDFQIPKFTIKKTFIDVFLDINNF